MLIVAGAATIAIACRARKRHSMEGGQSRRRHKDKIVRSASEEARRTQESLYVEWPQQYARLLASAADVESAEWEAVRIDAEIEAEMASCSRLSPFLNHSWQWDSVSDEFGPKPIRILTDGSLFVSSDGEHGGKVPQVEEEAAEIIAAFDAARRSSLVKLEACRGELDELSCNPYSNAAQRQQTAGHSPRRTCNSVVMHKAALPRVPPATTAQPSPLLQHYTLVFNGFTKRERDLASGAKQHPIKPQWESTDGRKRSVSAIASIP
jgi:hypothetical protein